MILNTALPSYARSVMSKKAELSSFEGVRWWKHAGGGADAPAEEANNW